ncbi:MULTISPECIES: copper resistance protein NlpE N-terminal domain-containing protein [Providencia]|uniref:Copper homeostasis protein CutF n=2 Tax=Providencia TaxID=586 RepID=A0A264VW44_PRORE|nr:MULTISPECIES: copper resistance protein NlpE N-terminal domain-containing protein [Providencia]EHZ6870367.1 copper resistance protein NlpE N-terminal domain-containing protein [Providencia rettgeri]MBG5894360.1 copper resistance protein NlpE N-terminal domain-containing protein [Providencia rettgeri]MBG5928208.1 copper resistance protein NlpE N-terminal domain-containing protein [Providencia rettgeri]MBJ9973005.1 copper resistance protein NlpE N-terminal domain-containing protein [Providenci
MKKSLMLVLMAVGSITLAGCQSATKNIDAAPVDKVYTGVLPCADCSGIEATLLVNQDGSYVEQLVYLGTKDGDTAFHDTGKWDIENNKLRATNPKGESTYFAQSADGQSVTLLDLDGNPIETQMNYTLDQVKPSKKVGQYRYMADAAVFKECDSGRQYAVSGVELEKAYGETGVDGGTPVYAEIEGYYTIRPSMEDGQFDSALVPTGAIKFDKSASCN